MRRHYHVVENTPGYLPESDPAIFRNRRQAVSYALKITTRIGGATTWGGRSKQWSARAIARGRATRTLTAVLSPE